MYVAYVGDGYSGFHRRPPFRPKDRSLPILAIWDIISQTTRQCPTYACCLTKDIADKQSCTVCQKARGYRVPPHNDRPLCRAPLLLFRVLGSAHIPSTEGGITKRSSACHASGCHLECHLECRVQALNPRTFVLCQSAGTRREASDYLAYSRPSITVLCT